MIEHPIAKHTRWFMIGLIVLSLYLVPKLDKYIAVQNATAEIIDPNAVTIQKPGIIKFDWTSGNLDYKGVNVNSDATDGDTDWLIYKYTWVGSNPTVIQKRTGSWTGRAALFP